MSLPLSFYIHIPYCTKRCGYCDFNTYTPGELKPGSDIAQVSDGYIDLLIKEGKIARSEVSTSEPIPTIFFAIGSCSFAPSPQRTTQRVIIESLSSPVHLPD